MGRIVTLLALGFLFAASRTSAAVTLDLQLLANRLTNVTCIANAADDSGRLFVAEQAGRIKIFNGTNVLVTPFLDISAIVNQSSTSGNSEEGLLGLVFHPGYKTNGHFYAYFTNPNGSSNVVARFTASPPNASNVSTGTMVTVLRIAHPNNNNHNGGCIQFGPDGYLYIGTGDGGSGCDPPNNSQSLGSLLGKLLRIDVNNFATNYTIPPSNPFIATNGARLEIWAHGLRNPWRFSFDRLTGDLFIGDVGQGPTPPAHEEVDYRPASSIGGENYGWRLYEGFGTNTCSVTFSNVPTVLPIIDYDHSSSRCAVMGGYRYRGTKIPPLYGTYLYADECGGQVYGAITNLNGGWMTILTNNTGFAVSTFGEDQAGELYLSQYATAGAIYRIVWKDTDGDGMADDWEQQYFGSTTGAVTNADPDGDGFTNLQEFLAGTNPTNAPSALLITSAASSGSDFVVNFASATNKLYRVEGADDLVTGPWTTLTNNITGTGSSMQFVDVGAVGITQRFYRVRLLP